MLAAQPGLQGQVPATAQEAFVDAVRGNMTRPLQGTEWAAVVYGDLPPAGPEAEAVLRQAGRGFFDAVLGVLRQGAPEFKPFAKAVGAATGLSGKALYQPLRAALTGRLDGPEMERLWRLMDPRRIEARFDRASSANL
jgi:glutamyl-tRNA synthetase